jgi:excisionase family DNA binding protein
MRDDGYMRRKEASAYLGISERTLGNWMKSGRVPYRRLGKKLVLLRRDELDAALDSSLATTTGTDNPDARAAREVARMAQIGS